MVIFFIDLHSLTQQ